MSAPTKIREWNAGTYNSSEVAVQLLDHSGKAPAGQVEECPTLLHSLSVPARGRVLREGSDVALGSMPKVELNQSPGFERMCDSEGEIFYKSH